nr:Fic family protein [Mesorhizobium sp. BR1-1-16]
MDAEGGVLVVSPEIDLASVMQLTAGSDLYLEVHPDGILLSKLDPRLLRQLAFAREGMALSQYASGTREMNEPVWLLPKLVEEIHALQIEEHGGAPGIRDRGLLESALGGPANGFSCGSDDLLDIAAANAFGVVRNRPFIDGSKQTAFLCAYVFLRPNGPMLVAEEASTTENVVALAAGSLNEFAIGLRQGSLRMTQRTLAQSLCTSSGPGKISKSR